MAPRAGNSALSIDGEQVYQLAANDGGRRPNVASNLALMSVKKASICSDLNCSFAFMGVGLFDA